MKFEPGKKYRTRDGSIAEITNVVSGYAYCVWAQVDGIARGYTHDGYWIEGSKNGLDLVEKVIEPNPDRRWTIVISSYTSHVSDQIGIEGEVLNVVPESRILDAESEILELEKQASRYQATVIDQGRRLSEFGQLIGEIDLQAVGRELDLTLGDAVSKNILPGIRALKATVADLLRQIESQNEYIERRDGVIADLEACIQRLREAGDHPGKSQPFVEVGGAYLTRGGDVAIVVSSDEDLNYPFDVETKNGAGWCVTRSGTEFRADEGDDDLVARIRFPEANVAAPEGFVCVGNKLLPEYHDAEDIKVCSWGDNGNNEYCVRIGSPVHFAFATKFSNAIEGSL
jgi:hypothetical protein